MGLFSFFKKNKKSNTQATSDAVNTIFDAVTESVTAYKMMEEDKAVNGEQTKRNVVFQPEHIIIKANRTVMTKGVPADYFFEGDERNKCAELPLLSPLKIDIEKAVKEGVAGKQSWEGSKCFLVAENDEYLFYNYAVIQMAVVDVLLGKRRLTLRKFYSSVKQEVKLVSFTTN